MDELIDAQISALDIERDILEHPSVEECAVIGSCLPFPSSLSRCVGARSTPLDAVNRSSG
jgi:hypothetical protein